MCGPQHGVPGESPQGPKPSKFPLLQIQKENSYVLCRYYTRLALKQARGEMSYAERLEVLHWSTLSSRREYLLCSFSFKCLSGVCVCTKLLENIFINPRRLECLTFRHLPARTQGLFFSPSRLLPRVWDKLPSDVKDAAVLSSLPSFLRSLKSAILSVQ